MFTSASASSSKVVIDRSVESMSAVSPTWEYCARSHPSLVPCDEGTSFALNLHRMKVSCINYLCTDNTNTDRNYMNGTFRCGWGTSYIADTVYIKSSIQQQWHSRGLASKSSHHEDCRAVLIRCWWLSIKEHSCMVRQAKGNFYGESYHIHMVNVRFVIQQQGHHRGMSLATSQ
jgi:hypothetical protein